MTALATTPPVPAGEAAVNLETCRLCRRRTLPWNGKPLATCPCTLDGKAISDHAAAGDCPLSLFPAQKRAAEAAAYTPSTPAVPLPWGPVMWGELHRRALTEPAEAEARPWLEAFARRLPCGDCREGWAALVAADPPDYGAGLFAWSVRMHNAVNRKVGKQEMGGGEARRRWDIGGYFARVYVISLARTPERLAAFWSRFPADWPFRRPEVFEAVDGSKESSRPGWQGGSGAWGCHRSWVGILDRCIADGVGGPVLVLEDDCQFTHAASGQLGAFLAALPADADVAFLGGQHERPAAPFAPGVVRCAETGRTHALVLYPHFFKALRDFWAGFNNHIDHGLKLIAPRHRFYAADPFIALQAANRSTITNANEPARSWDHRVSAATRDPSEVSVVLLKAPRAVVDRLRAEAAVHTGHWRDPASGVDVGLIDRVGRWRAGGRVGPVPELAGWLKMIREEAAAFPEAAAALWHPDLTEDAVRAAMPDGVTPRTVAAATVEGARAGLNPWSLMTPAVFYHVACMGNWRDVVAGQIGLLAGVGLTDVAAGVLGTPADVEWCRRAAAERNVRLRVAFTSPGLGLYELPTLRELHRWARGRRGPAAAVYLHTKGVSNPDDPNKPAWRRLMEKYVVGNWRPNIARLRDLDAVGVDWCDGGEMPHFSGNFWLARADWLGGLPDLDEYQKSRAGQTVAGNPWERMCCETWIGSRPGCRVESLACRNETLWTGDAVFRLAPA